MHGLGHIGGDAHSGEQEEVSEANILAREEGKHSAGIRILGACKSLKF